MAIVSPAPATKRRRRTKPILRQRHPQVFLESLKTVVGQEELTRKLASVFAQYTRYLDHLDEPDARRPLVLVYGPSGGGKTFAIEQVTRGSGLPFTATSSAAISPPSYKGKTMTDVLIDHWQTWHTDEGVIFLDEIDKWCAVALAQGKQQVTSNEDFSMGVRSQAELLKYVERDRVPFIDDAKDIESLTGVVFETRKILWVLAGAFNSLDRVIKARLHNFSFPADEILEHAMPIDFKRYGMLGELADRVGTWAWVKPLKTREIMEILNRQDRPYWEQTFAAFGIRLTLEDGALGTCSQEAWTAKEGPRVASSLLRRALDDILVEACKANVSEVRVGSRHIVTGRVEF